MKKQSFLMLSLLIFSVCLLTTRVRVVKGESKTIVVPDDYSSVQEAVDKAVDGDVVLIKHGTYNGSVIINKRITLIGEDKADPIILGDWSLNGTVVLVEHDEVVVEKLTLKAVYDAGPHGRGIHLLNVKNCRVSGCNFESYVGVWLYQACSNIIENNLIDGTKAGMPPVVGIKLQFSDENSIVGNNVIEFSYGFGISLESSDKNILIENQLLNNFHGIWVKDSNSNSFTDNAVTVTLEVFVRFADNVMLGCYGIRLYQSSNNSIASNSFVDCPKGVRIWSSSCYNIVENNTVSGSQFVGIEVIEDSNYNRVTGNTIIDNEVGANFTNSSNNQVYHNDFINNGVLVSLRSTDEPNFFDDGSEGNYWSSYEGADINGDSLGDTPFIIDEKNQDNYPRTEACSVPEFPSLLILPFFLIVTFSVIVLKSRLISKT